MFERYKEGSVFRVDCRLEFIVLNVIGLDYKFCLSYFEICESYGNLSDSSEIMI